MSGGWKVFWLAVVTSAVAFAAAQLLVPDVVPIGYQEEAQPSWAVLTAFVLRAIELVAAWIAAIALAVMGVDAAMAAPRRALKARVQFTFQRTGRLSRPRNAQPPILTGSVSSSRKSFNREKIDGSATSATMAREAKAPAQ
jgi:hypothetical protein